METSIANSVTNENAQTALEVLIQDIEAYNNTEVVKVDDVYYIDTSKGGTFEKESKQTFQFGQYHFRIKPLYFATEEEMMAAMTGDGKGSEFAIGGHTFYGHVFMIEEKTEIQATIDFCLADGNLNDWEQNFLLSIHRQYNKNPKNLSEKQLYKLDQIKKKAHR